MNAGESYLLEAYENQGGGNSQVTVGVEVPYNKPNILSRAEM